MFKVAKEDFMFKSINVEDKTCLSCQQKQKQKQAL